MDVGDAGLDALDDVAGISAAQHQDDSADHFAVPVQHGGAVPDRVVDQHLRHVADEDRRPAGFLDDDAPHVFERADQADAADDIFLVMFFQDVAAGIGVVARDRVEDFAEGQVVLAQHRRFDQHLILFDEAAHGVHIDHFRRAFQQRPDDPVLNRALIDQILVGHGIIRDGTPGVGQVVLEHLAQSRAVRHKHRFGAGGEQLLHFDQPFENQLAGQVDVHRVVEHDGDQRQADFGQGPHFRQ